MGCGRGRYFSCNVPLKEGATDDTFFAAFDRYLLAPKYKHPLFVIRWSTQIQVPTQFSIVRIAAECRLLVLSSLDGIPTIIRRCSILDQYFAVSPPFSVAMCLIHPPPPLVMQRNISGAGGVPAGRYRMPVRRGRPGRRPAGHLQPHTSGPGPLCTPTAGRWSTHPAAGRRRVPRGQRGALLGPADGAGAGPSTVYRHTRPSGEGPVCWVTTLVLLLLPKRDMVTGELLGEMRNVTSLALCFEPPSVAKMS